MVLDTEIMAMHIGPLKGRYPDIRNGRGLHSCVSGWSAESAIRFASHNRLSVSAKVVVVVVDDDDACNVLTAA
jgi:PII-like signaling protein